jgi:hypothetical protein
MEDPYCSQSCRKSLEGIEEHVMLKLEKVRFAKLRRYGTKSKTYQSMDVANSMVVYQQDLKQKKGGRQYVPVTNGDPRIKYSNIVFAFLC